MPFDPTAPLLIAEDDDASRKLLAAGLARAGYATIEAATGAEAIRLAVDKAPRLAILDIMLPDMRGTEVAEIIRREAGVPFVFLSALDESNVVDQAARSGALGYLVKPLNLAQLGPTIQTALQRASELERLRETETRLAAALAVGRETSVAIGILMERHGLTHDAAFAALRMRARTERRKVAELAAEVLAAVDRINAIRPGGGDPARD